MARVGDMLMQRFRSVQLAATHGWKVASELELSNHEDDSLVPVDMKKEVLKSYHRHSKIVEGLRRAQGGQSS